MDGCRLLVTPSVWGLLLLLVLGCAEGVCRRNGLSYETGESVPASRCRPCTCNVGGRIYCRRLICPRVNCIGARVVPGHCCPTCPIIKYTTYRKWTYLPGRHGHPGNMNMRDDNDSGSAERTRSVSRIPPVNRRLGQHRQTVTTYHVIPTVRRMRPSPLRSRIYKYLYIRRKT